MQEFLSRKVCTKLSIPYLSLHLWLQVCGSFPLMQETRSTSYSKLQVKPKHVPAVPPGCRCCPPSLRQLWLWRGQQRCGGTDLGCVGFTLGVPCAAETEPGDPSALLPLCRGCCATSSSKWQMPPLRSVFPSHCMGPMKTLQSSWGLSSTPNSGTCTQWL